MREMRGTHQSSGLSEMSSQFHDECSAVPGRFCMDTWPESGVVRRNFVFGPATFTTGWSPIVLVTTPPHPASNARMMLLSDSVGGADASRNGLSNRRPVNVVARSSGMSLLHHYRPRRCRGRQIAVEGSLWMVLIQLRRSTRTMAASWAESTIASRRGRASMSSGRRFHAGCGAWTYVYNRRNAERRSTDAAPDAPERRRDDGRRQLAYPGGGSFPPSGRHASYRPGQHHRTAGALHGGSSR